MRVGLLYDLGPDALAGGLSYDLALAQIEEADRLGVDSVLFSEGHGSRGCPAVASLVTAAAASTTAIRVGTADRRPALEYPVKVAEDFAVADIISRGRVILGVSPGVSPEEFRAVDVPWAERHSRFREAVELVRTAWTQGPVQFVGEHYRFPLSAEGEPGWRREPLALPYLDQWRRGQVIPQHLAVLPRPVQLPHPPIWVQAWDRDTIEWAARRGLTYLCSPLETDDEALDKLGLHTGTLLAAGRERNEIEVALARDLFLHDDGDTARDIARASLQCHVEAVRASATDDMAGLALLDGLDHDALLESCFLVGSPTEVLDRLLRFRSEGVTHFVFRVALPGREHRDVLRCIRLLAAQVTPRLLA